MITTAGSFQRRLLVAGRLKIRNLDGSTRAFHFSFRPCHPFSALIAPSVPSLSVFSAILSRSSSSVGTGSLLFSVPSSAPPFSFSPTFPPGCPAAFAAMRTELFFRAVSSGFYGALTESFREAEPPWAATLTVAILLPLANHSLEFLVRWMRGTRKLLPSIISSVCFTLASTLFNFYAMRRGALVVGEGRSSLAHDLRCIPRLLLDFLLAVPRRIRAATAPPVCPKA